MDEENEKIRVVQRAERHLRTYADLWRGAQFLVGDAADREVGAYIKYTGAFLMVAFVVEAYCNYIGPVLVGDAWDKVENPLERKGPKEKLKRIGKAVGVSVNFNEAPWARIKALIEARHEIVHAKRMDVSMPERRFAIRRADLMSQNFEAVDAPWEKFCRSEYLIETMEMIEGALKQIHSKLPPEDLDEYGALFVSGMTFGSISIDHTSDRSIG